MEVLVEGCRLGDKANPLLYLKPDRLFKVFGSRRESLILSCQEKSLSLALIVRTANRHR